MSTMDRHDHYKAALFPTAPLTPTRFSEPPCPSSLRTLSQKELVRITSSSAVSTRELRALALGQTRRLALAERRHGNKSEPRGLPSLITTIINANSTPKWTTYETHSPDLKRVSSTVWGGASARETNPGLVDPRRASARRARFHNQNLASRRAVVASKKETERALEMEPSERALWQMITDRAGRLPPHLRPNWCSGQ